MVGPHEEHLNRLEDAIHLAGSHTISESALDAAWSRTDYFNLGAVVIDYELKDNIAASAFLQRFTELE